MLLTYSQGPPKSDVRRPSNRRPRDITVNLIGHQRMIRFAWFCFTFFFKKFLFSIRPSSWLRLHISCRSNQLLGLLCPKGKGTPKTTLTTVYFPRKLARESGTGQYSWIELYYNFIFSFSCGECHRRKQKVSVYLFHK